MLDLNLFFTLDRDWSIFNRSKVVAVGSLLKLGQACSNKKYWQSRNFDFFRFLKKYFPSFATEKFVPLQTRESWHFFRVINNSNKTSKIFIFDQFAIPSPFFCNTVFSVQKGWNSIIIKFPMIGFEPEIGGYRSVHTGDCDTATAHQTISYSHSTKSFNFPSEVVRNKIYRAAQNLNILLGLNPITRLNNLKRRNCLCVVRQEIFGKNFDLWRTIVGRCWRGQLRVALAAAAAGSVEVVVLDVFLSISLESSSGIRTLADLHLL